MEERTKGLKYPVSHQPEPGKLEEKSDKLPGTRAGGMHTPREAGSLPTGSTREIEERRKPGIEPGMRTGGESGRGNKAAALMARPRKPLEGESWKVAEVPAGGLDSMRAGSQSPVPLEG